MKLEQLYYFQQAAKYHSISVAAKRNYISQSSFSGAISRLEKELGKSLLKRTNNGVELTPFGDLVLSKVDKIFQAQAEITEAAGSSRSGGTVRVSCIPGIHYRVLLETIQSLLQKQPNILLSVSTAESREIASRVSLGYTDFGIVVKGNFLNSFRDLVYHPLFQDRYQLYVGNTSPLWNASEVSWEKVCLQRHIGFLDEFRKNNGGLMEVFDEQKQPEIAFWTDDLDSMKQMIAQTNYVALFPHFMGKGDIYLEHGHIRTLPIQDHDTSVEVGWLESKKYHLSPLDKEVLRILTKTVVSLTEEYAD